MSRRARTAGALNLAGVGLRSLQAVEFSFNSANNQAAGGADLDQTITKVNLSRAVILMNSIYTGSTGTLVDLSLRLTDATNLRLHHGGNGVIPIVVKAYVLEFAPGALSSIQEVTGAADPQTIQEVNPDKSVFIPSSFEFYNQGPAGPCGAVITSATELDWEYLLNWGTTYGQVVEFR